MLPFSLFQARMVFMLAMDCVLHGSNGSGDSGPVPGGEGLSLADLHLFFTSTCGATLKRRCAITGVSVNIQKVLETCLLWPFSILWFDLFYFCGQ